MEVFNTVSATHSSCASSLYRSSLGGLLSGLSGARGCYAVHRLVMYERAALQFPCCWLFCSFIHLLPFASLGAHRIIWEFGGLYLVEQGSLHLPSVHLLLRSHRATACTNSSKGNHGDGKRSSSSPSAGGLSLGSKSRSP